MGLKADGIVVSVVDTGDGQCDVWDWTGIVQVTAGWHHTLGLKADGTAIAVGSNDFKQCNVVNWNLNM